MPQWLLNILLNYLVPMAVSIIKQFGLPALEARFPGLVPLVEELLCVLKGGCPSQELHSAALHYKALKVTGAN